MENLELTQEWDKVFPKSNKVDHQKITFHNRYGITLAAEKCCRKALSHCGQRSFRRGEGAVFRAVCSDNGGVWILDHRL